MTALRSISAMAALAALVAPGSVPLEAQVLQGTQQAPAAAAPADPAADAEQVAALVKIILAVFAAAPDGARAAYIEARLSFAIDQAQPRCSIAQRALTQIALDQLRPAARAALRNISLRVARCDISGTAALTGAEGVLAQGTTLGLGGGSSNYVRP